MNKPNNRRKKESVERMERAFIGLLQTKELDKIRVSELCAIAGLDRSTFYDHYADIYALADSLRDKLIGELAVVYQDEIAGRYHSHDYLKLFRHIRENQLFYKTYFKLGYDNDYQLVGYDEALAQQYFQGRFLTYHMEFFKSGLTRVLKLWVEGGCRESPEEIFEILKSEYQGRVLPAPRPQDGK